MKYNDFYVLFENKSKEETLYEKLYKKNPQAYEMPVKDWHGFCTRYQALSKEHVMAIPEEAPTQMLAFFEESHMFSEEHRREVEVIVNARYCPAFLHKLDFIKLIYVFRGSCIFYVDNKQMHMSAGNVSIVAPGVEQAVFSSADDDIVLNLLIRRSTFAEAFGQLLEINNGGIIADFFWKMLYHKPGGEVLFFHGQANPLMDESVMELYEEVMHQPVKSDLIMKSLMLSVFAYTLRWNEQKVVHMGTKRAEKRYPLAQYMLYMKQNLEEVTLASMAQYFQLSEGYLSRYFKKETSSTFSKVLREMKMKKAAQLLVKTECNIEKITALIGYTDESIFFRNFKEQYGLTPIVFRKKRRIYKSL